MKNTVLLALISHFLKQKENTLSLAPGPCAALSSSWNLCRSCIIIYNLQVATIFFLWEMYVVGRFYFLTWTVSLFVIWNQALEPTLLGAQMAFKNSTKKYFQINSCFLFKKCFCFVKSSVGAPLLP